MLPAYPEAATGPGRDWRLLALVMLLAAGAVAPVAVPLAAPAALTAHRAALPTAPSPRVPALWMPVPGLLVRGFDTRAGPYGPGHRGVDIAARVGESVRAPAAGEVVFAGPVAGINWVSILVAPGVLVTLGPLLDPPRTAASVRSRMPVGRVAPGHQATQAHPRDPSGPGGPGGETTLHLSVRVDGVYVDPLAYLVDRPRPRLAPLPTPAGPPHG
jgi:septal ring factor EnvC (AmiA/AmiB activator)